VTSLESASPGETLMPDLNSFDLEGVMNQVKGTARSMGVDVV